MYSKVARKLYEMNSQTLRNSFTFLFNEWTRFGRKL
ncbi:unnamed protein product [Acanthoscelides obtectus]|uniref:Uncharacterized protein n=1 Tax=Acanthoscelides obtectus TaxID=200917 RepID=A0A9P0Q3A5_ACAOB|nr:unnamed protein product [Acanthoscelides obtectus]CAK1686021.1 hypothetical protein AOBTE_LOCUS35758 [Acanthoscelides obtectus]